MVDLENKQRNDPSSPESHEHPEYGKRKIEPPKSLDVGSIKELTKNLEHVDTPTMPLAVPKPLTVMPKILEEGSGSRQPSMDTEDIVIQNNVKKNKPPEA